MKKPAPVSTDEKLTKRRSSKASSKPKAATTRTSSQAVKQKTLATPARIPASPAKKKAVRKTYKFELAFSFAGEDRKFVESVNKQLQRSHVETFYDYDHQVKLVGENLSDLLNDIYENQAQFCAIFISKYYIKKQWTKLERQAAQSRAFQSDNVYIIPIRLDDTAVPGILSTTGFIDARNLPPRSVVKILREKILETRAAELERNKRKRITTTSLTKVRKSDSEKSLVKKPSSKTVASKSFDSPSQISSSGAWLLLNGEFYPGATVKTEAGFIIIEIKPRNADEEERLDILDPKRNPYQNHTRVSYAHGNKAYPVSVESVDTHSTRGKSLYILKLRSHEPPVSNGMGYGSWVDETVERQIRLLLLNEDASDRTPAGYSGVNFTGSGVTQRKDLFSSLWQRLRGQRMSPIDVLRCARLAAIYEIKNEGLVDHISHLTLGPAKKGILNVKFKGRRPKQYHTENASFIEITGKCNLSI